MPQAEIIFSRKELHSGNAEMTPSNLAQSRIRTVSYENVSLHVRMDGEGPLVVFLPSQARDSDDYGVVADALALNGYCVLRPQPRGIGQSTGPLDNITLADFVRDVVEVIKAQNAGPAVIAGHAYGHYIARLTATLFPQYVKGIVVAAAAARSYPPELSLAVSQSGDPALPDEVRLAALRLAFFAPGNDAAPWLSGWHPHMQGIQRAARAAIEQDTYWHGGEAPILDLQAEFDPFKPPAKRNEMQDEFGARVSIALIRNASHALIPEQPAAVADAMLRWMTGIGHTGLHVYEN